MKTEFGFDPKPSPLEAHGKVQIPWFIGLFLPASVARSLVPGSAALSPSISHLAAIGLPVTPFLIGAGSLLFILHAIS